MRVLKWMLDRLEGKAEGEQTAFGVAPQYAEINWTGIDFNVDQFNTVTKIDTQVWAEELASHQEHFDKLAHRLPQALLDIKADLEKRLKAA